MKESLIERLEEIKTELAALLDTAVEDKSEGLENIAEAVSHLRRALFRLSVK